LKPDLIKAELDASGVYLAEEVERFCRSISSQSRASSIIQAMNAALDPAVSRFRVRQQDDEAEAEE